jgi:SAM-dependent methyltransferase
VSHQRFYESQAELYDLAFSWDIEDEAAWLLERFGPGTRSVLEPACGNGRLFPDFARRGVETAGVDLSREMIARAETRMRVVGLPQPFLVEADIRDFDLGRTFDGAFCPVNSLGYMHTADDMARHLACVARHLRTGGRYLVQLGLRRLDSYAPLPVDTTSQWDVDTPRGVLRTTWISGPYDPATRVETQISRFEWRTGTHAGHVVEFEHHMRLWDWAAWSEAVAASSFREVAAWDGDLPGRPALSVGPAMQGKLLAWHELEVG